MQTSPLRESHSQPKASEVMVEGIYEAARALASAPPPRSLQAMLDVLSSFLELQAASLTMFGDKSAMDIVFNTSAQHSNMPALIPCRHRSRWVPVSPESPGPGHDLTAPPGIGV